MHPTPLSVTFLAFALLCAGLAVTLPFEKARLAVRMLVAWLGLVAAIAGSGFLAGGGGREPRFLVILLPMLVFWNWLAVSDTVGEWARGLSPEKLMLAQIFRLPVETLLYFMAQAALVPQRMTFEGRNFDGLVALTAPLAAWAYSKFPAHRRAIGITWNVAGMLVLGNTVVNGVLSAPGPQRLFTNEVPNLALTMFPYVYIASVFVLLAISLHITALRAIRSSPRL